MHRVIEETSERERVQQLVILAAAQPFMSIDWRPPSNGVALPKAVDALMHDWITDGPWSTNEKCLEVALAYCLQTARVARRFYKKLMPQTWQNLDDADTDVLIEIGAQISDVITPYGGDSRSPSLRECGVDGYVCDVCLDKQRRKLEKLRIIQ